MSITLKGEDVVNAINRVRRRTILTTYSDHTMTRSLELCCSSAQKHGVDVTWPQNPNTVTTEFKEFNKGIFQDGARGAGCYWLFKPYIIYKSLLAAKEGDILIYADAGVEFVNSVHHIIDRMDEDIFFFTNGFPHAEWCKGDVLTEILNWGIVTTKTDCGVLSSINWSTVPYSDNKQVQASVIFFKVNQKTRDFAKEWLLYSQMPGFIDDSPSQASNYRTFAEHRHDQAILTCLQIKHGYKLHFWPTNYSEHIRHTAQPEDNYPTIFNHHRKRNSEWI